MNDVLKRIFNELEKQEKNASDMCKELKIASSTFFTWKTKDKVPPTEALQKIAKYLGVSIDYLVNGEQPSYYLDFDAAELAQEMYDRPEMKVLFDASRKATKEDIETVADLLRKLSNK